MEVTKKLRKYAVDHLSVANGATDDEVRKAISAALVKGDLTAEKLQELTKAELTDAQRTIQTMVTAEIGKAITPLSQKIDSFLETAAKATASVKVPEPDPKPDPDLTKAVGQVADDIKAVLDDTQPSAKPKPVKAGSPQAAMVAGAGGDGAAAPTPSHIRVKEIVEGFDDIRTAATWDKSDSPHCKKYLGHRQLHTGSGPGGRSLDMPTERSKAIAGAWFKHMLARAARRAYGGAVPVDMRLSELDRKLCEYAVHNCRFVGPMQFNEATEEAKGWVANEKITDDLFRKTLLDDTTSGGLEAVPIEFDAAAILTPLLSGELFPYVAVRNVTRRRIEGFSVGNPSISWGTAEGSQISLFNTDTFIAAFDTTIYPVAGSIEIGLDFEADSPVNVGDMLVTNFGSRFRQEMDNVIATGNGTNRPQGIVSAGGTAVTPAGGAGAAPMVDDYEGLLFGVAKEYRAQAKPTGAGVYLATETSYQRARAIQVGAADERRVFGMDHESYTLLGHRFAINESLTNAQQIFVCLNAYRMYRRQGFEVRIVTEDKELARKNQRLILVRARFGGKMENGNSSAINTTAQA